MASVARVGSVPTRRRHAPRKASAACRADRGVRRASTPPARSGTPERGTASGCEKAASTRLIAASKDHASAASDPCTGATGRSPASCQADGTWHCPAARRKTCSTPRTGRFASRATAGCETADAAIAETTRPALNIRRKRERPFRMGSGSTSLRAPAHELRDPFITTNTGATDVPVNAPGLTRHPDLFLALARVPRGPRRGDLPRVWHPRQSAIIPSPGSRRSGQSGALPKSDELEARTETP